MGNEAIIKRLKDFNYSIESNVFCDMEFDIVARKDISRAVGFYCLIKTVDFLDGTAAEVWKRNYDYLLKKNTGAFHNNAFVICLISEKSTPAAIEVLSTYNHHKMGQAVARIYIVSKDIGRIAADIPMILLKPVSPQYSEIETIFSDLLYLKEI